MDYEGSLYYSLHFLYVYFQALQINTKSFLKAHKPEPMINEAIKQWKIYEYISLLKFVKWQPLLHTELFNFVVSDLTTSHSPMLEAWEEPVKSIPYSFLILIHL